MQPTRVESVLIKTRVSSIVAASVKFAVFFFTTVFEGPGCGKAVLLL